MAVAKRISPYVFPGIPSQKKYRKEKKFLNYINMHDVLYIVGNRLGVSLEQMKGKYRGQNIVTAKHIFWYLCRKNIRTATTTMVTKTMGMIEDHSTVTHGCQKIQNYIDTNQEFRKMIDWMQESLEEKEREYSQTTKNLIHLCAA